jgi:hypothetical protein
MFIPGGGGGGGGGGGAGGTNPPLGGIGGCGTSFEACFARCFRWSSMADERSL